MAKRREKYFLFEGATWEGGDSWWRSHQALKMKTVEKTMENQLRDWDGARKFAIVKSESGIYAKRVLGQMERIRKNRADTKFHSNNKWWIERQKAHEKWRREFNMEFGLRAEILKIRSKKK